MKDFTFCAPTRAIFGRDTELTVGRELKAAGATKVLMQYGGGSIKKSGLYDRVVNAIRAEGIELYELGGVQPNPHLSLVRDGIELARAEGVDFVLAVGGGSVIDSAKAIGYGVANDGDVWDFYLRTRKPEACLPIGVVLTIAASGSEMSDSSVVTDDSCGDKRSCGSNLSRPVFAVMDPELLATLPAYQTSCGTTDILMHTMERYFTSGGNMQITDAIAEGLMRTVMENGLRLVDHPDDYDARAEVMWAGSLSHNGLTGCGNDGGDFLSHNLEHQMSGMFDVAHGAGLAAVWPSWARYVYKECLPRFVKFAVNVMGVDPSDKDDEAVALLGIEAMERYFRSIGMPTNMRELGIEPTEEQLAKMAHDCAVTNHGKRGSAKVCYEQDFLNIYRMAL